jgi:isopenicillin N synthase-like dioxygenase
MALPVLDAMQFLHGSIPQRNEFANSLLNSCKKYGFVKIVNHGISDAVVSELFAWASKSQNFTVLAYVDRCYRLGGFLSFLLIPKQR